VGRVGLEPTMIALNAMEATTSAILTKYDLAMILCHCRDQKVQRDIYHHLKPENHLHFASRRFSL
jgi:hypothetical protein